MIVACAHSWHSVCRRSQLAHGLHVIQRFGSSIIQSALSCGVVGVVARDKGSCVGHSVASPAEGDVGENAAEGDVMA